MKDILIVNLAKRFGGAEQRVVDLSLGLKAKISFAVAVLADSPLHNRLLENGVETLPIKYGRGDIRSAFIIKNFIISNAVKLVDVHNVQSQLWGLLGAKIAGLKKIISTMHSSYGNTETGIKKVLYEFVIKLNRSMGCEFIAVSEAVEDYLLTLGINKARINLIPNAIDVKGYRLSRNAELIKSFGWSEDSFIISSIGRLVEVKGHIYLIEAMAEVIKNYPEIKCLIVGDGRLYEELDKKIKDLGLSANIVLTGFRSDIKELLSISDLFCMPSLSEGLPYALMEACASSVPILASNVGGIAKFLVHNETGFLIESANKKAISDGIIMIKEDNKLREKIAHYAYDYVKNNVSIENMVDSTLKLYRKIIY